MSQISLQYTRRESDLLTTIIRVVEQLDNNPDYPDVPAALAALKKLQPEYQTAHANAKGRDKKMVSIKNDMKANALNLLQEINEYVALKSKGDRTLILSSGFDATDDGRNYSNQEPFIGRMEVELGESGEAITRVRNVKGVKAYIHQYTTEAPGANTIWIGEGSSDARYRFQGLSSEKRYWFRVVVIGYNRQRAYSQVVSRVIQ